MGVSAPEPLSPEMAVTTDYMDINQTFVVHCSRYLVSSMKGTGLRDPKSIYLEISNINSAQDSLDLFCPFKSMICCTASSLMRKEETI